MSIHLVRIEHIAESLTGTVRHEEGEHYCRRWKFNFTDSGMENIKLHFPYETGFHYELSPSGFWKPQLSCLLPLPVAWCGF